MPKQVDHDARRAEIAAALSRVVLRDGVEAATVRAVAAEAGWSAGALRHYFPDQAALLRFAVGRLFVQVPERLARRLAARPGPGSARTLLEEVLPLDDVRRVEMHLWLATMDRARHDRGFDEARLRMWDAIRFVCRVAAAWTVGSEAPPTTRARVPVRAERRAAVLHALVDGLAVQTFHYPERMPPEAARRVLRDHLDLLALGAGDPAGDG